MHDKVENPLLVRKYGGTSIGSVERMRRIAQTLVEEQQEGKRQVVVVSAMAKMTDQLLDIVRQVSSRPSAREIDMMLTTGEQQSIALLAMAVQALGGRAVSLTGPQCGIRTDGNHSEARIQNIATSKIQRELDGGNLVIVAGFQGVTAENEITTLGRGGSDTTAAALAAALGAPRCEICTDVDGVFTADPRIVPDAKLLRWISYQEMLEYAASGSQVLHPRCVEIAYKFQVPIQVRSSFGDDPGTTVVREEELEKAAITGVTGDPQIARVALTRVKDVPGVAAKITGSLAGAGIKIRLVIQGIRHDQSNDVSLIIEEKDAERSRELLRAIAEEVGSDGPLVDTRVAKVSIVGSGVASTPGVAARMFQALADEGINIELISTSEIRIACIIGEDKLEAAVRAIHREFDLAHLERERNNGNG
jgi:aspartate kinase